MMSQFILDVLNLNLSSPCIFILGLFVLIVLISATLNCIMISDECVITNSWAQQEWHVLQLVWHFLHGQEFTGVSA